MRNTFAAPEAHRAEQADKYIVSPRSGPPRIFRVMIAGRSACSARRFVASSAGLTRKLKAAGNSVVTCIALQETIESERMADATLMKKRGPRKCARPSWSGPTSRVSVQSL